MVCKMESGTSNGTSIRVSIAFDYQENLIYRQRQLSELKVNDRSLYEDVRKAVEQKNLGENVKGMKGIAYDVIYQDHEGSIDEKISFDLEKVSGKDYGELTGQPTDKKGKLKLGLKETNEIMEKSGFICTK